MDACGRQEAKSALTGTLVLPTWQNEVSQSEPSVLPGPRVGERPQPPQLPGVCSGASARPQGGRKAPAPSAAWGLQWGEHPAPGWALPGQAKDTPAPLAAEGRGGGRLTAVSSLGFHLVPLPRLLLLPSLLSRPGLGLVLTSEPLSQVTAYITVYASKCQY